MYWFREHLVLNDIEPSLLNVRSHRRLQLLTSINIIKSGKRPLTGAKGISRELRRTRTYRASISADARPR